MPNLKVTNSSAGEAYVREEQYLPGCPAGAPYNWQTWLFGTTAWRSVKAYDGPDSRVRPSPLIWNPTPRGPLYTWTCQYLFLHKHTNLGGFQCYAVDPPVWIPSTGGFLNESQWLEPCTAEPPMTLSNNDLVTAVRLGIKDQSMNLADFIGEYRETVDMMSSAVKGVVDTIRNVRDAVRGRAPKAQKNVFGRRAKQYGLTRTNWHHRLRNLPSAVLLSDFGLAPMVDSAREALEVWNARATQPLIRRITSSRRVTSTQPGFEAGYTGKYESTCIDSKRAIVYVRYDPEKSHVYTAGNAFEAYWASVPFSFLIDKFVNFGDFLSSLDAMVGVLECQGTITTKRIWDAWSEQLPTSWAAAGYNVVTPGKVHMHSYQREVIGQLDLLPVLPSWQPSGSARLLRDLTAILASFHLGRQTRAATTWQLRK